MIDYAEDLEWDSSHDRCEECGSDDIRIFSQSLVTTKKHVTCIDCIDAELQTKELWVPIALALPKGVPMNPALDMVIKDIIARMLQKANDMNLTLPNMVDGEFIWEEELK